MEMIDKKRCIIVAKSAGFCWGVRRAFDKVMDIAQNHPENKPIHTYGPLIHNSHAVNMLKEKGIHVLETIPETANGTIVIRTHGVPPDIRDKLKSSGAKICDATCPDVAVIQGTVRKHLRMGCFIIIIGNKEHPEVEALLGFAEERGACVNSEKEVAALSKDLGKICVVSQSTQQRNRFHNLVDQIKSKYPNCIVFDTICKSTVLRQEEVRALADEVDAMVVVGGRNSSNTNRLAEISRETKTPTFFIENDEELNLDDFLDANVIGITAGASTPNWIIDRVILRLQSN